jgi:predicted DNA-binding ribbon-helix-helix protein
MANSGGKGESAPTTVRRLAVHGGLVRPSVYVRRSKITISLEPSIWEAFQEIAAEQGKTVNELAAEIEENRIGNNLGSVLK